MGRPYYEPQSIAPILERGLAAQAPYLAQPKGGMVAALPVFGDLAKEAFAVDAAGSKRRSLLVQQQVYADYLAKVDAGTATESDHKTGMIAGLSLGLTPPDLGAKRLQRSNIEENEASAKLKGAQAKALAEGQHSASMVGGAEQIPGSPFFRDPITGMLLRVKPGHKGNELIPLPGQSIGESGKIIYTSDPENKPTPAETAKTQNLARAGLGAIAQIRGIIQDPANKKRFLSPNVVAGGAGGGLLAAVTGDTQSQILVQQIQEAGDAIARLRTGAAITDSEEARYGNLLRGRFKTPEAYENALRTVETFLTNVERDLQTGRRKLGAQPAAATPAAKPDSTSQGGVKILGVRAR